jgi:leucyl aminopeptidase
MPVVVKIDQQSPARCDADVLVVLMRKGKKGMVGLPARMDEELTKALKARGFNGDWGQVEFVPGVRQSRALLTVVVGVGDSESGMREAEGVRRGLATVALETSRLGLKTVGVSLAYEERVAELAAAVFEGVELSGYGFTEHSKKLNKQYRKRRVSKVTILCKRDDFGSVRKEISRVRKVLGGVAMTRDLVNQPAGHMSPRELVKVARAVVADSPELTARILDRAQAKKEGFSAFLAVAQGSDEEPYVIHLKYIPRSKNEDRKKVWLVGKGITFDSGGLSLKPSENMEFMKDDMAGAATVLGLFSVLGKLEFDIEVHGVIAACENMPSGSSYRPGDVVTAKNGKTIEVINTDAEGRITLADALSYAAENKPDAIVDIATLTGACMVALGETVAGLWSTDADLGAKLVESAKASGEWIETMPMPDEYVVKLESQVADMANLPSSRYGGAIAAAMFLREFVGDVPWGHLDIAGPAFMDRRHISYWDKGGTGFGVRTLVNFLEAFASGNKVET